MLEIIIPIAATAIVLTPVIIMLTSNYRKKVYEAKVGSAEEKARQIIDEAVKTSEAKKREDLLEIKEETIRSRGELDKEIKERRIEVQRSERRIAQKEESIEKKIDVIEIRELKFIEKEEEIIRQKAEVSKLNEIGRAHV